MNNKTDTHERTPLRCASVSPLELSDNSDADVPLPNTVQAGDHLQATRGDDVQDASAHVGSPRQPPRIARLDTDGTPVTQNLSRLAGVDPSGISLSNVSKISPDSGTTGVTAPHYTSLEEAFTNLAGVSANASQHKLGNVDQDLKDSYWNMDTQDRFY